MSKELVEAIVAMDDQKAMALVGELMDGGADADHILAACQEAMEQVGKYFADGEYFLPELIMSGEILKGITAVIKPHLEVADGSGEKVGKVVFGTVYGDIHDIGKDIVIFMLETNNFEVVDLGVDVPIEKFVAAVKEENPDIVGMSGFLTNTFDAMKATVAAFSQAGMREDIKIMIGGGTVTEDVVGYAHADAYGDNAMSAVTLAKRWMGGK